MPLFRAGGIARAGLLLSLLVSLPAGAQGPGKEAPRPTDPAMPTLVETGKRTATGYDEFFFIGWSDGCSAALRYFSYAPTGHSLEGVPVNWSVGSLSILPGSPRVNEDWLYKGITSRAWERWRAEDALKRLSLKFVHAGRTERIPPPQPGKTLGPDESIIRSTAAFQLADPVRWPPSRYRLEEIRYSPLGTCLLTVFRDTGTPTDSYRYRLVRIRNPSARRSRSRAHVSHGLLLYQESDIYGALEELSTAASMDPESALARYHHAAMLATHGRGDEALAELKAAIALEPGNALKAKKALEFDRMKWDPRFKELVRPKKKK